MNNYYSINQMELNEEWRRLPDFPDYEVSNIGKVRSLKRGKQRILKDRPDGSGYYQVVLCKDGKEYSHKVHRLVAMLFLTNTENKQQIDHINRNIIDNRVENLRWCTRSENMLNTHRHYAETYGIRWLPDIRKYKVQLNINRNQTYLGCFETLENAKDVRDAFLLRK